MIEENDDLTEVVADPEEATEKKPKSPKRWRFMVVALAIVAVLVVGMVWWMSGGNEVKVDRKGDPKAQSLTEKAGEQSDADAQKNASVDRVASLYEVPKTDATGKLITPSGSPSPGAAPIPASSPSSLSVGAVPGGHGDPAWQAPNGTKPVAGAQPSPSPLPTNQPNNAAANKSVFFGPQGQSPQNGKVTSQANTARATIFGEKKVAPEATTTDPPASLPFVDIKTVKKQPILGTMLPVSLMGAVYTHGLDNLVRLRLSRDISGDGWAFRKGTLFVGKVKGGIKDRAFVEVMGYLDAENSQLVKLQGQVMGSDGGTGLKGKKQRVTPVMGKVLDRLLTGGTQIASSALNKGGAPIYIQPTDFGAQQYTSVENGQRYFVEVAAGQECYIMISEIAGSDVQGSVLAATNGQMTGTEFAELLASGNIDRLRANLSRMSPEMRRAADDVLREVGTAVRPY